MSVLKVDILKQDELRQDEFAAGLAGGNLAKENLAKDRESENIMTGNKPENKTENKNAETPDDFGGRLLRLRRQRGLSQEEMAEVVGVSRQAVSKWEGAQTLPDIERLLVISDYFGVSTDWLLKGDAAASINVDTEDTEDDIDTENAEMNSGENAGVAARTEINRTEMSRAARQHSFMVAATAVYSFLVSYGGWVSPVIGFRMSYYGIGEFVLAYGVWLIVCLAVWRRGSDSYCDSDNKSDSGK